MEPDTQNSHSHGGDIADTPWTDRGGMLSPISGATADSEQRSLMSPNNRVVGRRWTEQEYRDARKSQTSFRSVGDFSDAGSVSVKGVVHGPWLPSFDEFKEFISACQDVEQHLESFTHQVQKLGSAFGLVVSSRDLHACLSAVRKYFEENAQNLGLLLNKIKATKSARQAKKRRKRNGTFSGRSNGGSSFSSENSTDNFIGALNKLARSVKKFTAGIVDFEDYTDEEGNKALQEFENELMVLSGGLEFFSADGESDELRRFVTARASSLTFHLKNLSEALVRFETIGIPCISFAQKRSSRMLLNAATVATFFAGVAATTLQYSVVLSMTALEAAVNTLWFCSLVLSIGAAITGMTAMTWRLAVFSSPKRHLPWYIRFWIRSGYMALLTASVIAFLAGLLIFVFDTMPRASFWIVTAFTAFCILGLSAVAVLFAKERYFFSRVRNELRKELSPASWQRRVYESADEGWWYWLRFHLVDQLRDKRREFVSDGSGNGGSYRRGNGSFFARVLQSFSAISWLPWRANKPRRHNIQDSEAAFGSDSNELKRPQPWKQGSKQPASGRRGINGRKPGEYSRHLSPRSTGDDIGQVLWYNSHVKSLGVLMSTPMETRVVHLQFSPDGHWLVVCYKYECSVFDVLKNFEHHTNLRHINRNAKQIEWSPNSKRLITRASDFVKVWRIDESSNFASVGKAIRFEEVKEVTDIQWLNNDEFLAITDELHFFRVNVSNEFPTKIKYDPEPENHLLEIYYLYTLPEHDLVMIVGARKIEDLDDDKAIDCIIAYQMERSENEAQSHASSDTSRSWKGYTEGRGYIRRRIPLLNELESLSFGSCHPETIQRPMVLSYSDKPPEIWSITVTHEHIYVAMQKELVKKMEEGEKEDDEAEWGEASLVGPTGGVIACAEDGVMYFWDLDGTTSEQFHRLKIITGNEEVEELPLISWIGPYAENALPMMATAGKGFSLKIWAPMKYSTVDDAVQVDGVEYGQGMRADSNGHQLLPSSDSGMVQITAPQNTVLYPSPYPMKSSPGPIVYVPSYATTMTVSPDADILPRGASLGNQSQTPSQAQAQGGTRAPIAEAVTDYFDREPLVEVSPYCSSPTSSMKNNSDQEEIVPED